MFTHEMSMCINVAEMRINSRKCPIQTPSNDETLNVMLH